MTDQMFITIHDRFNRLERLLEQHAIKNDEAHTLVTKHESYVNFLKWIGTPGIITAIAGYLGFKHLG